MTMEGPLSLFTLYFEKVLSHPRFQEFDEADPAPEAPTDLERHVVVVQ